jgi:ectoine hydroxylase
MADSHFTAAERIAFARDGYIVRERVFTAAETGALRDLAELVIAGVVDRAQRPDAGPELRLADGHRLQFSSRTVIQWEWADGSRAVRLIEPFTHLHPGFAGLWTDPRLVQPMQDALGVAAVAPYTCKLNLKRPHEGSQFPWHQDYTYWYAFTPATAHEIATAILFLDDADAENGAIRVLPGSQRHGPAPRDRSDPTRFLADPMRLDTAAEQIVAVPAGSLLLFPALLVHRSSPNTSPRQRRAILPRFNRRGAAAARAGVASRAVDDLP